LPEKLNQWNITVFMMNKFLQSKKGSEFLRKGSNRRHSFGTAHFSHRSRLLSKTPIIAYLVVRHVMRRKIARRPGVHVAL